MALQEQIEKDLLVSMRAQQGVKTEVLRFLKSALKYVAIEKKTESLTDTDAYAVVNRQIKQRRESIDQFEKAGRNDLADKEKAELAILETYLPKQLSDAELEKIAAETLKEIGASSKKDFGKAMKALTAKLAGQVDNKRISDLLGKKLP